MAGHAGTEGYKDVVLFLATAGVVVPLFKRLKISPILGFLGAGVALGPHGLGALAAQLPWLGALTVSEPQEIAQLAELGVVFLLFMIGLELSWERLRLMRRWVFGLGAVQVIASAVLLGGAALMLGRPFNGAVVIGAALSLSSTAVVMAALAETRRMHSEAGRAAFSILLFQDLAVAPVLLTLSVLAHGGGGSPGKVLLALAPAAGGLVALIVVGRLVLRPMMKSVARAKSQELFLAAALLVVIGAGVASALAGLSMALGAFIAGLLLAETEFRHEVEVTIEPFKGLLLGLFFVSVGIGLNLSLLAATPLFILAMAVGLIAVKAAVITLAGRVFKVSTASALEAALPLAAGGEFAFVILGQATGAGVLDSAAGEAVQVAVTLSMFAIPALSWLGRSSAARMRPARGPEPAAPAVIAGPRVIIAGYGRVGRLVAEMLDRHETPWIAADRDVRNVEAARSRPGLVVFGNAAKPEFLHACGLPAARALVVTMDDPEAAEAIVATARAERPDMVIVARARDARHAQRLYDLGATDAVPETIEASLQLSEAVLVDIGTPMGLVIASIHERRDEFRKFLNRPEALGARGRRARDAIKRG